jgi:hypothetical protein
MISSEIYSFENSQKPKELNTSLKADYYNRETKYKLMK